MAEGSEVMWRREVDDLTSSVAQLIARCERLRRQAQERGEEVKELRARVAGLEQELAAARERCSVEQAGRAFGPGSEDSRAAREMIKGMVREIDACIALLRS